MFSNYQNRIGNDITGANDSDFLGWSVALSHDGSRVAVGAKMDNLVRVYELRDNDWRQMGSAHSRAAAACHDTVYA